MQPDYLAALRTESARFLDALRSSASDARVPTCPDWSAQDLLWHLAGDVQWFWASVVAGDPREDHQVRNLVEIDRPDDYEALLALFTRESARLQRALSDTPPGDRRWMWVSDPVHHTVAYIARRQAHEALIHRVDAELTAGQAISPIDATLAADGVDEAIRLMHGNRPAWGQFTPEGARVRFVATDTGDTWVVELGRFAGTSSDGTQVDTALWRDAPQDNDEVADGTISGSAEALDLWLWSRPGESLIFEGDPGAVAHVKDVVGQGVG